MNPVVIAAVGGLAALLLGGKKSAPKSTTTDQDYPTMPASGNLDPMLDQSEQYELANYTNDQLYNDAMASGHLAFVAAAATKLASSGDTRAADLTLRVANWGK